MKVQNKLIIKNACKEYGDNLILRRLSLEVCAGEVVIIGGKNGAGKSTLVAALSGQLALDSGSISITAESSVSGLVASGRKQTYRFGCGKRQHPWIAVSPQVPGSFPGLTVSECFYAVCGIRDPVPQVKRLWASRTEKLSGGQQKQLANVLALHTDALVVALDEPEAGLDRIAIEALAEMVRNASLQQRIIIITAHRPSAPLLKLAAGRYWLEEGELQTTDLNLSSGNSGLRSSNRHQSPQIITSFNSTPAMLEIRGGTIRRKGVPILSGVNLRLVSGDAVVVAGGNGSGKSTLGMAVAGLVSIEGYLLFNGEDIADLRPEERNRLGITFVPQAPYGIFEELSVDDNLRTVSPFLGSPDLAQIYIWFPELFVSRNVTARYLSGGMKRILALSIGLRRGGHLLIIDEPLAGLGHPFASRVMTLLSSLKGVTTTLVFEHAIDSVKPFDLEIVPIESLSGESETGVLEEVL